MKIALLLLIALVGGLWQNWDKIWEPSPVSVGAHGRRVVMYATKRCGYCARMRSFLRERGIAYEERDVDESAAADREFRRLGGDGVPFLVIDEKIIVRGYQPDAVLGALNRP